MAYTANRMLARTNRRLLDFDPDSASETIVDAQSRRATKCLPLSDGYQSSSPASSTASGPAPSRRSAIFVSDDAAGVTNATNVVSHAIGSNPDAVGDTLWLEVTAEQCKAALATARTSA
jgi:hypothetical protein